MSSFKYPVLGGGGGTGDVVGPVSATNNAVARFDGVTGKLLQDSVVLIGDTGAITGVLSLTASGLVEAGSLTVTGATTLATSLTGPLKAASGVVSASAINLASEVTGTLPVGNGGTGATTFTANGVLLGNTSGAVQVTAAGTANQVLRIPGGGGAPEFGAIDLAQSAAVTGALPVANGGTNSSTALNNGRVIASLSGAIAESAFLYSDATNSRLGIGTASPVGTVDVTRPATSSTSEAPLFVANSFLHTITSGFTDSRTYQFNAPTITAASPLTVTNAATVYVAGAPTAAGSATLTNRYAMWVDSGNARFDGNLWIGVTSGSAQLQTSSGALFGGECQATYYIATNGSAQSTLAATRCTGNAAIAAIEARASSSGSFDIMRWQNNAGSTTYAVCNFNGRFHFGGSTATAQVDVTRAATTSNSEAPVFAANAHTQTITGTLANARFNQFLAPTITAGTAQTATNAATVYIDGAPVAAGSATITNNYALWVDSGTAKFDGAVTVDGVFTLNDGSNIQAATSVVSVSSDVTLTNKAIHLVDTSTARSLTLPSPTSGAYIVIKDSTGSCATNNITIVRAGSEKIETVAASYVLNTDLVSVTLVSNGTDWFAT